MRHNQEENGFITGLLLGSVLGAMAAILLAPKSGKALRSEIVTGGEHARDRAVDKVNELLARGERAVEDTKAAMSQVTKELRDAAENLRHRSG